MYPHWRYVIETIIGRIRAGRLGRMDRHTGAHRRAGPRYEVEVEDAAATLVELEGGAFGTILSSWATRVRRDDLFTLQVDGTRRLGARRPAPMPRAVRGADAARLRISA